MHDVGALCIDEACHHARATLSPRHLWRGIHIARCRYRYAAQLILHHVHRVVILVTWSVVTVALEFTAHMYVANSPASMTMCQLRRDVGDRISSDRVCMHLRRVRNVVTLMIPLRMSLFPRTMRTSAAVVVEHVGSRTTNGALGCGGTTEDAGSARMGLSLLILYSASTP